MDKRRVTRIPSIFDSDDDEEPPKDENLDREDIPTGGTSCSSPASVSSAEKASESATTQVFKKPLAEDNVTNNSFGENKEEGSLGVKNVTDDKSVSDCNDDNDKDDVADDDGKSEENIDGSAEDKEDIEMKDIADDDDDDENYDKNIEENINDNEDKEQKDDVPDDDNDDYDIIERDETVVDREDISEEEDNIDEMDTEEEDNLDDAEGEDDLEDDAEKEDIMDDVEREDNLKDIEKEDSLDDVEREDNLEDVEEEDNLEDVEEEDNLEDVEEEDNLNNAEGEDNSDVAENDAAGEPKDDLSEDEEMLDEEGSLDEDDFDNEDDVKDEEISRLDINDEENANDEFNEEDDMEDHTNEAEDIEEQLGESDDTNDDIRTNNDANSTTVEKIGDKRECSKTASADDSDVEMEEVEGSPGGDDNGKQRKEDEGNGSKDEEESGGYVIDLNESDSEDEALKPEEKEAPLDSSSSSPENGLKIDMEDETKPAEVDKKLEKEELQEKELSEEHSVDSAESGENKKVEVAESEGNMEVEMEETEAKEDVDTTAKSNIKQAVVPQTKKKLTLVQIPVKVSDVYTDSEEESEGTNEPKLGESKDEDIISSTTASADLDDQKDISSLSSRQGSVEPDVQLLPSIPASQPPPSTVSSTEVTLGSGGTTVFKKKRSRRSAGAAYDRVKCLYALEQGWRREMVHRATIDPTCPNKVRADVYYYTPSGKKLRSKVEIEDFLIRKGITDLTIENFCFAKERIGGTETQEVIRHATKCVGGTPHRKVDGEEVKGKGEKPVLKLSPALLFGRGKKRGRPRGEKHQPSPKRAALIPVSSQSETENKTTFRNILPKSSVKVTFSSARPVSAVTGAATNKTPTAVVSQSSGTQKAQALYGRKTTIPKNHVMYTTKLCESETLPPRVLTPMLSEEARQQAFHCTGLCPLGVGQVPNLQCMKCLCLFHARCTKMPIATLEIIHSGGAKFLCPNCYKEQKGKATAREFIPPKTFEPLATDPIPSESDDDDDSNDGVPDPSAYPSKYIRVNLYNTTIPTPPASPGGVKAEDGNEQPDQGEIERRPVIINPKVYKGPVSQASAVTSSTPEGLSTTFTPEMMLTGGSKSAVPSSSSNVIGLPGGQLIKIQAQGANVPRYILVRPSQSSVTLPAPGPVQPARPMYIPSVAGHVPFVLPNTGLASMPSLQPYGASAQTQLFSNGGAQVQQIYSSSGYPFPQQTVISSTGFPSTSVQSSEKSPPVSHHKLPPIVIKKDFLQELSRSYRLLLHVFKYLTAKDLLVTSRVCLMWRDLSYSPSLWSTVRLRNICVRDWKQLAFFLERRNTTAIDLRKMVFRVQQSSFDSEEPSRLDSSGPPSPASSQSNDLTPSSTTENTPQKELSTTEKNIDEESETKSPKVINDNDAQTRSDETPPKEGSVSSANSTDIPEVTESSNILEASVVPQDELKENVKETEDTNKEDKIDDHKPKEDTDKENLDVSGPKKEIEELNSNPPSENEDEPMETDENAPSVSSKLPTESHSKGKDEEIFNVTEKCKSVENEREKEHRDKSLADDQKHTPQERVTGNVSSRSKGAAAAAEKYGDPQSKIIETWSYICEALGTVRCLKSVVLPSCRPIVLQLLLANCKNLTSVTAAEVGVSSDTKFDPAYLMEVPSLKELRIGSTQGFSFATNFNFIKLPELKVLVIRGFMGSTWPYLGTNLMSLHLGPCRSFTPQTWANIGSMTRLKALWLEDGGFVNDAHICEAIGRLTQLRRLCLFNFTVGSKLGAALRKLHKLERLFVLQNSSDGVSLGIKNHNMLAVTEHLKNIVDLVWAVSSRDIKVINGVDHMQIFSPNIKSYPSLSAKENTTDQWPVKLIETVVSRHLPSTEVRIMKLDPAAAARMALSTL